MERGHPDARLYPLGLLLRETERVESRRRSQLHQQAILQHLAVAATRGKKPLQAFHQALDELIND